MEESIKVERGMRIVPMTSKSDLRSFLRAATRHVHDRLDSIMSAGGWETPEAYADFLRVQHAARLPIEDWASHAATDDLDLPRQADLILADLSDLGEFARARHTRFALPTGASPLGALWAVAGSSLGNRVIAKSVRESNAGRDLPMRFLSDPSMGVFWKSLMPLLAMQANEAEAEAARQGALAVFDHFEAVALSSEQREAA